MSNIQRRAKNISKIPLIDVTENKTEIPFNDPRSPSANVSRTPVDLYTYNYNLPNVPTAKIHPINSTR